MNKKDKFLKFVFAMLIFLSVILYVGIFPNDELGSELNLSFKYNSVPYLNKETEEVALAYKVSYDAIDTFNGIITAYGPDCVGCVSGLTSSGYRVGELVDDTVKSTTITYTDDEYGKVRILAASQIKFPYGTIIRVTGPRINGEIMGIVLDTGIAMRKAWQEGNILIDILFPSEKSQEIFDFGRQKDVKFEVLRYGF